MAAVALLPWSLLLRPFFPKTDPLASFVGPHWSSQARSQPPRASGTPPRHSIAAVRSSPSSSSFRPLPAQNNFGNGFTSPQRSSQAQPPPHMAAGTPPPVNRPAAAPCFTPASPVRPSPRAPRPPAEIVAKTSSINLVMKLGASEASRGRNL
ncbi:proline-rich receptor-like protein kinase PERK1 [Panicum virgatum]|uniref:proline-rich receptor-like protein kinase PERK1 n=1 Tax=Panicum virgatum TaxID=38727 RepID=UPI0019D68978|nr:proline-rich receptor-like protein kinase PERK1 [Panicum virgatum]